MKITRRDFIKKSSVVAGGFFIVPRHVLGRGYTPPSDKLNIAGIGCGGKGEVDLPGAWNNGKNNIVALCDVDFKYAKNMVNKFPDAKQYKDFREMLDKEKGIDAVTVTTPDHTHATIAMTAMLQGKHVYVQKPLTHNIFEARTLTETARRQKVVSQMGNQGASGEAVRQMVEWFDKGLIGTVHTVHVWTDRPVWPQGRPSPTDKPVKPADLDWDLWLGPAKSAVEYHPLYHPFKWRGWWDFGTGALGDMACHMMDPPYRVLGLGYPQDVECSVGQVFSKDWVPDYYPDSCPPSSTIRLKFGASKKNKSDVVMNWYDGGIRPPRPELIPASEPLGNGDGTNGVFMIGSKGIMTCGLLGWFPKIFLNNGQKITGTANLNDYKKGSIDNDHQALWAEACKAGFNSKEHKALTSSFDYSGPLTETVLMGNLAIRSYNLRTAKQGGGFNYPGRQKLLWDGMNMKITNFDDANQFVKRDYRDGWKLA